MTDTTTDDLLSRSATELRSTATVDPPEESRHGAGGDSAGLLPALTVVGVGVSAAFHVGKLPPAVHALQAATGMSLVDAGLLLSLLQLAGMLGGLLVGASTDRFGARRSMATGSLVLALASLAGGFADTPAMLMALRAVEGCGFLLVVLPAPALIRRLGPVERGSQLLGFWGGYMPTGVALGLLAGPFWIEAFGWRSWWWFAAACSAGMCLMLMLVVPQDASPDARALANEHPQSFGTLRRFRDTLAHPGPWLVAMSFGAYSSQWTAVIGFLPVIYEQNGLTVGLRGPLTALASAVNIVGNLMGGRLLQRGVRPMLLLAVGFAVMGLSAIVAFAGAGDSGAPGSVRYVAVLVFSTFSGTVPATLYSLALRVAPTSDTVATTVGWMQQWSAFGQFISPPAVALLATAVGGWQMTWAATGCMALAGLLLTWRIGRLPSAR